MRENDPDSDENRSTDPASPAEHETGQPHDTPPPSSSPAKPGTSAKQGNSLSFNSRSPVFRLVGLGTELAGFTVVMLGIGYAIDSAFGHATRFATAAGALLGFTLGMVRFIRNVRRLNED